MTLLKSRATLNAVCLMVAFCALLSGQQSSAPDPPSEPRQQETQPPSAEQTQPPSQESGTHKATPAPSGPATSATPAPEQQNAKTQKSPSRDSKKTKTGSRKVSSKKRKPAGSGSSANDGKVVVRNGGARDSSSQLTPGMTQEQQAHSRENTAQLLATTDSNLKSIAGRQLSDSQQSMLDQIHTYVRQSKAAADLGDLPRAHTLAYKAHLLSDELARK